MVIQTLIPKVKSSPILVNAERIFQRSTDFIRGNPIVSTASIGAGVTGLVATAATIVKRKKTKKRKKKTTRKKTRRKTTRKRKKRTKAEIRRIRLRNLAKARRARKKGSKRRKKKIIRGRGLGSREIKHSGRGTKGKHKFVTFTTKDGRKVRFKARR